MTKKNAKLTPLDNVSLGPSHPSLEEMTGGIPSQATQDDLAQDEIARPLQDADFFDYCTMAYERQGKSIVYYIKKNGKYLTTLKPPMDWDKLRKLFGSGHYSVQCKDELTNAFMKQKSEVLDDLPEADPVAESSPSGFLFQPQSQSSSSDSGMSSILALMQTQNEQRAISEREQRIRDEASRREDRERDEARRKEERDNRNDLLKTLLGAVPMVLPLVLPKKDDKLEAVIEIMKENSRESRSQIEKLTDKLERALHDPKKTELNPIELMKMMNEAKKDGRKEMEELLDMVEERAERRAGELSQGSGEKEESTLSLLIKNLGPAFAAMVAGQGGMPSAVPLPESAEGEPRTVESSPVANSPAQSSQARVKTKTELEQEKILTVLIPFFAEQFTRIQSGTKVDAKAAARESLGLLKLKGFSQERVVQLFQRETLFAVLRAYNVPNTFDSWFNDYYDALVVKEAEVPARAATVSPLNTRKAGTASRHHAPEPAQPARSSSGFIPATAEVKPGGPVESIGLAVAGTVAGKDAGPSAPVVEQLTPERTGG